jgi:DNA-directed RNA polymerase specialized sigma subunit
MAGSPDREAGVTHFNNDPEWQRYVERYETVIKKVAVKYCTNDASLRQDLHQEARIALLTVFPEKVEGYAEYKAGTLDAEKWEKRLDRYCRQVIRYAILSYLQSPKTGNWYVGRTIRVKNSSTGKREKRHTPPRYSSLDELTDDFGMQVDEDSRISWPSVSNDGLEVME